jgi:hypothetical protein
MGIPAASWKQFTAVSSNAGRPHEHEWTAWSRSICCFKREAWIFQEKSFKTLFCSTFLANSLTNSYGTRPHSCRKLFWNTLVVVRRSWNVVLFLHSARKCGTRVLACVAQSCKLSDALLQDTLQDHSRFWTDSCETHALILMTPVWDSCKLQDTLLERAGKTPL